MPRDPAPAGAPVAARVQKLRDAEDAALAAWRTASTTHERAVAHRDAAIAKARARVERAMRPLSPLRCERMEAAYAAQDFCAAAGYVRDMGSLRRRAPAVAEARARLAEAQASEDAKVKTTRAARAQAARALLALPPLPDGVVGMTRQQLGSLACE